MLGVSSFGCYDCLSQRFVAFNKDDEICIALLNEQQKCDAAGTEDHHEAGLPVIQKISHSQPYSVTWSENSSHLVVITKDFIYLYKCLERVDVADRFKWVIERSVEAPRDLTSFYAGYSHPLLSLEQDGDRSEASLTSNRELVVINLLCSLFQTFSIANIRCAIDDDAKFVREARAVNRLSHSGRYLSTAQIVNNPQSKTSTLGIRVYDLQDLWVLQKPTAASYLDFKYADLPVRQRQQRSGTVDESSGDAVSLPSWDVLQLAWRYSDAHSSSSDAFELFFVSSQAQSCSDQQAQSRPSLSAGIASEGVLSGSCAPDTGNNDVSVSIYSVSLQPDYENISILTMAYNAAIVAGQLQHADDFGLSHLGSREDRLSGAEASTYPATQQPLTPTLNLLAVVSLDSLCRWTPSSADPPLCGMVDTGTVWLAWLEPQHSTEARYSVLGSRLGGSLSGSKRNRDIEQVSGALTLALHYTAKDPASQSDACVRSVHQVFSIANRDGASVSVDRSSGYSVALVSNRITTVSAGRRGGEGEANFSVVQAMRCWGRVGEGNNSVTDFLRGTSCTFFTSYRESSQGGATLLAALSLLSTATPQPALDRRDGAGTVELCVADWRTWLVSAGTAAEADCAVGLQRKGDVVAHTLLPSAGLRFTALDPESSLFLVTPVRDAIVDGDAAAKEASLVDLSSLAAEEGARARVLTAVIVDTAPTASQEMYILFHSASSSGTSGGSSGYSIAVYRREVAHLAAAVHTTQHTHAQHSKYIADLFQSSAWTNPLWRRPVQALVGTTTAVVPQEYTTTILPDPHFGLGIRIDVADGRTVVSSFKRHPITNMAMSAQATGAIHPGDEFVAINGKLLRGLALSEVIHAIRTTVSEGGEEAVTLTMQRCAGTLHAHGSISTLTSGVSVTNLSTMPDRPSVSMDRKGSSASHVEALPVSAPSQTTAGTAAVPLCTEWQLVGRHALSDSVLSADLALVPSGCTTDGSLSVLLVAVHSEGNSEGVKQQHLSLSSVCVHQTALSVIELDRKPFEQFLGQSGANAQGTGIQLWTGARGRGLQSSAITCSVLHKTEEGGRAELPALTSLQIELDASKEKWSFARSEELLLVPAAHLPGMARMTTGDLDVGRWRWVLLDPPVAGQLIQLQRDGTTVRAHVRHRYPHASAHHQPQLLPHLLPKERPLRCALVPKTGSSNRALGPRSRSLNPLVCLIELYRTLSSTSVTSSRRMGSGMNSWEMGSLDRDSSMWQVGGREYEAPALAVGVLSLLGQLGGTSALSESIAPLSVDGYGQRALALQALARTAQSDRRDLCGAAVGNLLFANEHTQSTVLSLLLPKADEATLSSPLSCLAYPPLTSAGPDILAVLTDLHAGFWLRDLSLLSDVIHKHALGCFKRTKSAIQIFLEMVLVGKEETLLQLAKTDREKPGRQLLALLTLDDTFTSERARRSLQKNAFALMKLHRYRDAAAVFLLADPPFTKEAGSVLNKQYNNPQLAFLVTRLVEYKQSVRRNASKGRDASPVSVPISSLSLNLAAPAVTSSEGYILGTASRQLLRNDLLPALLAAYQRSTLHTVQDRLLRGASKSSMVTGEVPAVCVSGTGAAVLSLVAAMWLQAPAVVSDTFEAVVSRYSAVDHCTAACTQKEGHGGVIELASVLSSADWLLQAALFTGAEEYKLALLSLQEFCTHTDLPDMAAELAQFTKGPALQFVLQSMQRNGFRQHCQRSYEESTRLEGLGLLLPTPTERTPTSPGGSSPAAVVSVPPTPTVLSASNSMLDLSLAADDPEYTHALRNAARFQLLSSTPSPTIGIEGIAVVGASSTPSPSIAAPRSSGELAQLSPPAPRMNGGFNFSSVSRPTTKPSAIAELPPAPVRRLPPHSPAPVRTSTGRRTGASLDLLGDGFDMFPSPVRPSRPAAAISEAPPATDSHPAAPAPSLGSSGFNFSAVSNAKKDDIASSMSEASPQQSAEASSSSSRPVSVSTARTSSSVPSGRRTGAPLDLLGDSFDMFPPPVRHTRSGQTSPTPVPVLAESTPLSDSTVPTATDTSAPILVTTPSSDVAMSSLSAHLVRVESGRAARSLLSDAATAASAAAVHATDSSSVTAPALTTSCQDSTLPTVSVAASGDGNSRDSKVEGIPEPVAVKPQSAFNFSSGRSNSSGSSANADPCSALDIFDTQPQRKQRSASHKAAER